MHFYHDIDEWELFDLEQDPRQLRNLYGTPGTETVTEELMAELHRLQALYGDPIVEHLKGRMREAHVPNPDFPVLPGE